jgi:hypothetical protein
MSFHQEMHSFFIIYHSLQSFERHITLVGIDTNIKSPPINDYLSQQIKQPISPFPPYRQGPRCKTIIIYDCAP